MKNYFPNAEKKIEYTQPLSKTKTEPMKFQTKAKIESLPEMYTKIITQIHLRLKENENRWEL